MLHKKKRSVRQEIIKQASVNIAQYLANIFIDIGYLVTEPFETHYHHGRRIAGWMNEAPVHRVRQTLERMRDKGWIKEAERNGKKFLELTEKGRLEILYKRLKSTTQLTKKKWDGKWRLIMFDIPEQGRKERDAIRDVLKSIGFHQIQKSVYIYPHEIPSDAVSYLKKTGLWAYVRFARIENMENDSDAKKYFDLQ